MEPDIDSLKYPIGKFSLPETFESAELDLAIESIEKFPQRIKDAVEKLSDKQLDTPYRPEGWTIRQVVHHCADSHINSIVRFKLALTEFNPTINPYLEHLWAELADSRLELDPSLKMLEGLHKRWTTLLRSLDSEQWNRTFYHPQHKSSMSLKIAAALYAWHCNHHLAHILNLKERQGWE